MSLEHIVKHTCRFNIKNPQHRKVNEVLAENVSYISRNQMDSQKEGKEPQDDDTISDYALSYLLDGMEEQV